MDVPTDLIWDVAAKTALVLALLYAVLWTIRRYYAKAGLQQRSASILVVQSAQLGPGRSVHLIGVGGKMLLVGATSQQVSLLAEVGAADLVTEPEAAVSGDGFDRYLRHAIDAAGSLSSRLRKGRLDKGSDMNSGAGEAE